MDHYHYGYYCHYVYISVQVAFRLGLSYLPLAMTGIEALEQWSRDLESSVMMPHYKHVLPYLNDYLKSSATDSK